MENAHKYARTPGLEPSRWILTLRSRGCQEAKSAPNRAFQLRLPHSYPVTDETLLLGARHGRRGNSENTCTTRSVSTTFRAREAHFRLISLSARGMSIVIARTRQGRRIPGHGGPAKRLRSSGRANFLPRGSYPTLFMAARNSSLSCVLDMRSMTRSVPTVLSPPESEAMIDTMRRRSHIWRRSCSDSSNSS